MKRIVVNLWLITKDAARARLSDRGGESPSLVIGSEGHFRNVQCCPVCMSEGRGPGKSGPDWTSRIKRFKNMGNSCDVFCKTLFKNHTTDQYGFIINQSYKPDKHLNILV